MEHDTLQLCKGISTDISSNVPPAATTGAVDAAIELFALLLPVQDLSTLENLVTRVIEAVRSPRLERNAGRKSAACINTCVALGLSLRYAIQNPKRARDTFGTPQVNQIIASFAKVCDMSMLVRRQLI